MSNKFKPEGKVVSEVEFRRALLNQARNFGCYTDVVRLLDKYDKLIQNCTNEVEREHMGKVAIAELYKLFDCYGGLTINGEAVIPPEDVGKEQDPK